MRSLMMAALGACTLAAPLAAQEAPADQIERAVLALEDEYDEAYGDWRQELMARSSAYREERKTNPDATLERLAPIEPTFWPRFDEAATAGSTRAQMWCIEHFPSSREYTDAQRADFTRRVLAVLADPKAPMAKLPGFVMRRGMQGPLDKPTADALLVLIGQVATDQAIAAEAAYDRVALFEERNGTEEQKKATLEGYRAVAAAFPTAKHGMRAGGKVFTVERLQIGMVAPEIIGKDVDGNDMKLSDFRGKVTVIDFWGFW